MKGLDLLQVFTDYRPVDFQDLYGFPIRETKRRVFIHQNLKTYYSQLAAAAQDQPVPSAAFRQWKEFFETGNRTGFEKRYFHRRLMLGTAYILAVMEGKEEHVKALEDIVWEICSEWSWCVPAHMKEPVRLAKEQLCPEIDLFSAETAHSLSEIHLVLGDKLDALVAERIKSEIDRRIISPMCDPACAYNWEKRTDNWSGVCGSCIGMTVLMIGSDKEKQIILPRIARSLDYFLKGYGDDGYCREGLAYWEYGFGYFIYFAQMLRASAGLDLFQDRKISNIGAYSDAVLIRPNCAFTYSDSSKMKIHPGIQTFLNREFPDRSGSPPSKPELQDDPCFRFGHMTRNLWWHHPDSEWTKHAERITTYYPSAMTVIHHSGEFAFYAKGGNNGEPHNHNDLGSFMVHAFGENLFVDLGAGVYTAGYFGKERYEHLQPSSKSHSVPAIQGKEQKPGIESAAVLIKQETGRKSAFLSMDLTKAYDVEDLRFFSRSFRWKIGKYGARLSIEDTFQTKGMIHVTERWMASVQPEWDGRSAVWETKRGIATGTPDQQPERIRVETISYQEHDGSEKTCWMFYAVYRVNKVERLTWHFDFRLKG